MERKEEQLKNLLRPAGLEVVKFWSAGPESEGLFDLSIRRPLSDDSCRTYLCQCSPQASSITICTRNYTQTESNILGFQISLILDIFGLYLIWRCQRYEPTMRERVRANEP
jgi:hypothetical protein